MIVIIHTKTTYNNVKVYTRYNKPFVKILEFIYVLVIKVREVSSQ